MNKKRFTIIANIFLLFWYSLSMFGLKLGEKYLVVGALKDEWILYFKDCIQLVPISGRYVPDLYHIILHILILIAFISVVIAPDKPQK